MGEIISEYRDANEMYKTYMTEEWRKVMYMDDRKGYERGLRLLTGGNN